MAEIDCLECFDLFCTTDKTIAVFVRILKRLLIIVVERILHVASSFLTDFVYELARRSDLLYPSAGGCSLASESMRELGNIYLTIGIRDSTPHGAWKILTQS